MIRFLPVMVFPFASWLAPDFSHFITVHYNSRLLGETKLEGAGAVPMKLTIKDFRVGEHTLKFHGVFCGGPPPNSWLVFSSKGFGEDIIVKTEKRESPGFSSTYITQLEFMENIEQRELLPVDVTHCRYWREGADTMRVHIAELHLSLK